ncbi:hypothetical protein D9X30_0529 [Cupriavidus sp. U2]|uniref:hypothetical protein n=1 Tax=Cupriavidus sp. U2 TaxID=2920269 RepID=UPI00129DB8F5|nr:hypothetical protein [Cupriavidus sp. U2]KAI3594297.1 hypothetical protein D9X30_0529 [Cupriavidus sp. U2]
MPVGFFVCRGAARSALDGLALALERRQRRHGKQLATPNLGMGRQLPIADKAPKICKAML